jgi:hypothetical protein
VNAKQAWAKEGEWRTSWGETALEQGGYLHHIGRAINAAETILSL